MTNLNLHNLSTKGIRIPDTGYVFFGSLHSNPNSSSGGTQQPEMYCGTSSEQGNIVRSLYSLNSNGPIQYNETVDDEKQILLKYANYLISNAALAFYPYLYPLTKVENRSAKTQIALDFSKSRSDSNRIYKCLGKGVGEVIFMRSGPSDEHYDGYLYSGTLVQLTTMESPVVAGVYRTCVIPYRQGRGIPNYATNYSPIGSLTTNSFPPFGEMNEEPMIAPGIEPGESNTCFGIVLDTATTASTGKGFFNSDRSHNAPHTIPARSVLDLNTIPKTQGFLSPGPNQSGVYFAPWPRKYAYSPGESVPVLTKGITTARIGAAYNVALMSYGIRTQVSATDEIWVPVQTIPLFDGERIEAGSYIYASVKGHKMTPGSFQGLEFESSDNKQFLTKGIVGQTPWDHFVDSTYGNHGWTGTPGLSFSNLPDTHVSILQTIPDENNIEQKIPYLSQANQGSIIVHPITSVGPSPAIGNAYLQSEIELSTNGLTESEATEIRRKRRVNLQGISGRCVLSQTNPEKAQPIGILLETIVGAGRWTYTSQSLSLIEDVPQVVETQLGGAAYRDLVGESVLLRGGSGTNKAASFASQLINSPNLGTITGVITETVAGTGYTSGDILVFMDTSLLYYDSPQYKGNNATVMFTAPDVLTLHQGNTMFVTESLATHNLTLNSGYFLFFADETISPPLGLGVATGYQNLFNYVPEFTMIRVLVDSVIPEDQGYFTFSNYPTTSNQNLVTVSSGANHPLITERYFETSIVDYNRCMCLVDITFGVVSISDYGAGHKKGDLLLEITSDNNIVFRYPAIPLGYQELIESAPNYTSGTYGAYDPVTNAVANFTVTVVSQKHLSEEKEYFPIHLKRSNEPIVDGDYNLVYNSGYDVVGTPSYHSNRQGLRFDAVSGLRKLRGGTNYTTATNVSCYNLTANSLRLLCMVENQVIRGVVPGLAPYDDPNYQFNKARYLSADRIRILHDGTKESHQAVIELKSFSEVDGLQCHQVRTGGLYPGLVDGNYIFQTQRLNQENPTVDITVSSGRIRTVRLNRLGKNNRDGDVILITQSGTNTDNATFIFHDNMPIVDLPPYATSTLPNHKVVTDSEAWKRYSDVMSSAVNLLDKQVLIELRPTNDQPMENITPYGFIGGANAPPTENIYKTQTIE